MGIKIQAPGAELSAIFAVCSGKETVQVRLMARLRDEHFNHTPTKQAWRRIRALTRSRGRIPDYQDLCEDTSIDSDCRRALSDFDPKRKVKSVEDIRDLIETLDRYRLIRAQMAVADEIATAMDGGGEEYDPLTFVNKLQVMLNDMREGSTSVEEQLIHFGMDSNSNELIQTVLDQSIKPALTPTGFKTWDSKNGGFHDGSLVILAGSTGGGKSTVGSVQLLKNMSMHAPTCLVPLEMTKIEMTYRLVSNVSGIEVGKVANKKLTENEVAKANRAFAKWEADLAAQDSRYSIYEPEQDQTIEEILYGLQPFGYKVILIDYISLLKGMSGEDQWRQLGEAARFAKIWAKQNNCVVVLLAQLSDDGMIRYSKAVIEHANNAWFFVATNETRNEGIIKIDQKKARNQDPFSFELGIDYASMRVYDQDDTPTDIKARGSYAGGDDDDVPKRGDKSGKAGSSKAGPAFVEDDDAPITKPSKDGKSKVFSAVGDDDDEDAPPPKAKRRPLLDDD